MLPAHLAEKIRQLLLHYLPEVQGPDPLYARETLGV